MVGPGAFNGISLVRLGTRPLATKHGRDCVSIEVLPVTPDDLVFIFLHELAGRVFALDVGPCASEVQDEGTMLPGFLVLVEAGNLLGECIQLPLRYDVHPRGRQFIFLHELDSGVLLAHLDVLCVCLVVYVPGIAQELQRSLVASDEERTGIEAVAVVCEQIVDFVGVGHVPELFVDDIGDLDVCVGDQGVKVQPPYPVVLARLDEALGHVELPEDDGAVGVRFVVDDEVVAMAAGVVWTV
jgi:hypothetical protein